MTHLLDTNVCSAHMRRPGGLGHRFFQHSGGLAISTVILAELLASLATLAGYDRLEGSEEIVL
jgi:tRNA(fMet)-specific endonuclease VapC